MSKAFPVDLEGCCPLKMIRNRQHVRRICSPCSARLPYGSARTSFPAHQLSRDEKDDAGERFRHKTGSAYREKALPVLQFKEEVFCIEICFLAEVVRNSISMPASQISLASALASA